MTHDAEHHPGLRRAGRLTQRREIHRHRVFHVIALTSLLGYAMALWQVSIWYGGPWRTTIMATIDGIIYAIITGLLFVWFWPR